MSLFSPYPDRRAYALDWSNLLKQGGTDLFEPARDPVSSANQRTNHLGSSPRILIGQVADAIARLNCYRVILEKNSGIIPCTTLSDGVMTPVGTRSIGTIAPGNIVAVIRHEQLSFGIIIGVLPRPMLDMTVVLPDWIHQASRCGINVDDYHGAILRMANKGNATDWSSGFPIDSLTGGEKGWISETGMRVFVDSAMAQIGVDEATGVFAFRDDQLLRVAGVNLQVRSFARELEELIDQGELHVYDGRAVYDWEQLGLFEQGDPFRDVPADEFMGSQPHYSALEPVHDDQMPFHRVVHLGGYIGQGGKRLILAPGKGNVAQHTYDGDNDTVALFEEQLALTGRLSVRSAAGIHIAKRFVPSIKRMKRVEDPEGDNQDNYKSAGVMGGGEDHKVKGSIPAEGDLPATQRTFNLLDVHAYIFNWEAVHPLHYHEKDWDLPEDTANPMSSSGGLPAFGDLANQYALEAPEPVSQYVDHRYDEVDYYPNQSALDLLDDGGVSLYDGFGAQSSMVGGHQYIDAPGDIYIRAGRKIVLMAGDDVVIRAKNNVEVSATDGSIREKAEHNFWMVAGNGIKGGILIESKAPSFYNYQDQVGDNVEMGGVQIRTHRGGDIAMWATNIYMRSGADDEVGAVIIDVANGNDNMLVHALQELRYLTSGAFDYFGPDGDIKASNFYSEDFARISGHLQVGDSLMVHGGITANDWINVAGGHIATELADQYQGLVPTLSDIGLRQVKQSMQKLQKTGREFNKDANDRWEQMAEEIYGNDGPGNKDNIAAIGFSFRDDDAYKTSDFRMYEARWQQLARLADSGLSPWKEKPVEAAGKKTFPWPGKKAWDSEKTFLQQDPTLFDVKQNSAKDRTDSAYQEPKLATPRKVTPSKGYLIIG